jgi:PAS domain S-box-containing protein
MAESIKNLRERLDRAEAVVEALRGGEADAVVGKDGVLLLRLRQMEEQLRRSEERLRLAVTGGELGIWDRGLTTKASVWNDLLYDLLGRPRGSAITGETFFEYVHPDDRPRVRQHVARALEGDGEFAEEFRIVREDGQVRWLAARGRVYRDETGTPVRMAGVNYDITDRKRAEEALREQAARFRIVADNTYDFEAWIDADGRYHYASPSCECVTGYTAEEFLEDPGLRVRIVHPDDRPAFERHVLDVEGRHDRGGLEHRIVRKDGSVRWIGHVCQPVQEGDRYLGKRVSDRDITDRKDAEEALRKSREDLARAQEVGAIGSWRLDTRRDVLTWSEENHRIFGIPKGTPMTYETFLARVHPDDRAYVDERWRAGLRGEPYDIEHRILVDGQVKWVREKAYLEFDDGGDLLGGFGITQDMTDRKTAEEEVRKARDRAAWLARFPDENPSPVLRVDLDGMVLYANPPARDLPAWSVDPGDPLPEALRAVVRRALEEGKPGRHEIDLGKRTYSVAVAPFPQAGYANLYAEDVTARRRAQDALKRSRDVLEKRVEQRTVELEATISRLESEVASREQAEQELQRRSEELEALNAELRRRATQLRDLAVELSTAEDRERRRIAEVLHDDLQQTLVGVRFQLDMVRRWVGEHEQAGDMLGQIVTLVDDAVAKSQGLSHDLAPPALFRNGLVAGLQWLAEQMETQYGLAVDLDLDEAAEPASELLKPFLYKAVRELLFNVVKHAGINRAAVEMKRHDGQLVLAVRDEGKGFDPEALESDESKPGFGLMNIQERVAFLGGSLNVHAEPGWGSTFEIVLPARTTCVSGGGTDGKDRDGMTAHQDENVQTAGQAGTDAPPPQRTRVLLVDDHKIMREGLGLLLEDQPDLELVGEADNGKQAIDMAAALRPDVVVMDVSMPVMNGVEATRIIKREFPEIRIVGLSMYERDDMARDMLDAGAETHLVKTGRSEELLAAIRGGGKAS